MSTPFPRTLRSLEAGPEHAIWTVVLTIGVLALVVTWSVIGRVPIQATTSDARVEVEQAAHPVEAPVGGMVVRHTLLLDRWVEQGEVLLALDTRLLRAQLDEKRARQAVLPEMVAFLEQQLAAKSEAAKSGGNAAKAKLVEEGARLIDARRAEELTGVEAARAVRLQEAGVSSAIDLSRSLLDVSARISAARVHTASLRRIASEDAMSISNLQADMADIGGKRSAFLAERSSLEAAMRTLEAEIAQRTIRAPVAGTLGEVPTLQIGSVLAVGDHIATVVPRSQLRVVGLFAPAAVVGRIREAQLGQMRVDAYPWIQYGVLPVRVSQVGSEVRDGRVRVELTVIRPRALSFPLTHGLPGTLEVEVDRASPFQLVARSIGDVAMGEKSTASE